MTSIFTTELASTALLEVCANSFESALNAQRGGALRVELCDNLAEGGTTPSYAQILFCTEKLFIETWPIIRPRGGDFLYSDLEFELMKEDIKVCKSLNCAGLVFGILLEDGTIDLTRCKELISLAHPLPVAFHRAFDMAPDLSEALEQLISLGFVRVLSSGGASSAPSGKVQLRKLNKQAQGRITIMPGAGINTDNLEELFKFTGCREFHASAKEAVKSEMKYRNDQAKMGKVEDEYLFELSNEEKIRHLVNILHKS